MFAVGCLWCVVGAGGEPAYLTVMLPSTILVGIGVAATSPILAGAAVTALPPARSATGSALFNMSRQIGGVVGIAVLVAILGTRAPDLGAFRAGWAFMAASALAAGVAAVALPGREDAGSVVVGPAPAAAGPLLIPSRGRAGSSAARRRG